MSTKFFLAGHAGFYNRGCEAIVRSTIAILNKEFNNPTIYLSSFDYENDRKSNLGSNVSIIKGRNKSDRWTIQWIKRQLFRVILRKRSNNHWQQDISLILPWINKADVVLLIGGDNYTMDYGYPTYYINLNRLIKEMGKKFVIWGATIGPFPENNNLKDIVANLMKADLITVRESHTMKYLNNLGIVKNVKRVADSAFLLEPEPVAECDRYFDSGNVLGFNISPLLKQYHDNNWEENTINNVVSFLKSVIREYKMKVLLVPHVVGKKEVHNDYTYMNDIYKKLGDYANVDIIPSNYNAKQLKYIISKCTYFIGARTHATIAALSSNIPTLSIGYSVKARGINEDIFDGLDYVIASGDLAENTLKTRFDIMVKHTSEIKERLKFKIPILKKQAMDNSVFLRNIVDCK